MPGARLRPADPARFHRPPLRLSSDRPAPGRPAKLRVETQRIDMVTGPIPGPTRQTDDRHLLRSPSSPTPFTTHRRMVPKSGISYQFSQPNPIPLLAFIPDFLPDD